MNRKDRFGKNVFEGGFLGLDNIGVFDPALALGEPSPAVPFIEKQGLVVLQATYVTSTEAAQRILVAIRKTLGLSDRIEA